MRKMFSSVAVLGIALMGLQACADQPTTPNMIVTDEAATITKGGSRPRASASQAITVPMKTATGEIAGTLTGRVYLTRIDIAPDGQLVGTARIIGTATTVAGAQAVDITTRTGLSINGQSGTGGPVAGAAIASDETTASAIGTCEVLDLDLGPIHLDLLGLVVDLQEVNLDIVAQAGAGNLLGNLLCAVLSLFDGVAALAIIGQILEQINAILMVF
jgi:hypothetical protein